MHTAVQSYAAKRITSIQYNPILPAQQQVYDRAKSGCVLTYSPAAIRGREVEWTQNVSKRHVVRGKRIK